MKKEIKKHPLLSVNETAELLRVSTKTIYRGIRSGKITAYDIGAGTERPHYMIDISHIVPSMGAADFFANEIAERRDVGVRSSTHYTVAEAAAILGESYQTLYRRIKSGTLPFEGHKEQFSGRLPYTIPREALEKLLEVKGVLSRIRSGNISIGDLVLGMQAVNEQRLQLVELRNSAYHGLVKSRNELEKIARLPFSSPDSMKDAIYLAERAKKLVTQCNKGEPLMFTYTAGDFTMPAPEVKK